MTSSLLSPPLLAFLPSAAAHSTVSSKRGDILLGFARTVRRHRGGAWSRTERRALTVPSFPGPARRLFRWFDCTLFTLMRQRAQEHSARQARVRCALLPLPAGEADTQRVRAARVALCEACARSSLACVLTSVLTHVLSLEHVADPLTAHACMRPNTFARPCRALSVNRAG